ncbi:MAG: N-glycosylase/DNA lyase [Candidatus Marsarchaeota archaeon]|nr:N-glycosylase/DNA lyase [Candidatus Marsarchaeota archaeon]
MLTPDNVQARHAAKRKEIEQRLRDFSAIRSMGDAALLSELSFCISAANSSAEAASRAQKGLNEKNLLFSHDASAISSVLLSSHVRFHKNKAKYLIEARKKLFDEKGLEKAVQGRKDSILLRNFLADEVLGLGMKEAGHFLRNTGLAHEFAILDRHILKNLVSLGVIDEPPKTLTRRRYLDIEKKMLEYCEKSKIPIAHLDLLMWSEQTGRIFK